MLRILHSTVPNFLRKKQYFQRVFDGYTLELCPSFGLWNLITLVKWLRTPFPSTARSYDSKGSIAVD